MYFAGFFCFRLSRFFWLSHFSGMVLIMSVVGVTQVLVRITIPQEGGYKPDEQ
jgi:hypothetical protein